MFKPEIFYNGTISNDVRPKQEYTIYIKNFILEKEGDEKIFSLIDYSWILAPCFK